ncbi:uncharacterized protein LOC129581412 [Paramacrobiotus metropolitanus]|uniref:uncharacterized protein LOC129581412 n=1 Tax=Paramacrobiotus metropolitanus TaxID=2943436 RepID=UPI00244605D7|nr:uncharacterized protein LOC129581412 [Paramacrobiotus metropolitanus]
MESSESPSEAAHSPPIVYCDENISEEVQLPASLFSASAIEISFGSTSAVSGLPLSADCVEEFVYDLPLPHAYSDRMALALKAYKSGNLSQYAAAKKFKVPYTSFWKKLRGVTKQNFARHIVEKWNDFNMAANIVSGFVSSGIYPFNPDAVCRAYVEPVPSQLVSDLPISVANVYVSELQVVRRSLQKIPLLTEGAIEEILAFTITKAEGFTTPVPAEKVAADWHKNFMSAHPQKKKKLKDSRLRAEAGLIATDSKVIEALEQRKVEKLRQKNKRKKNSKGLSDITNTPTKNKKSQNV